MNAADVLWKLIAAGVLPDVAVERACEVLEVSKRELQAARARYECPAPLAHRTEKYVGESRTPVPAGQRDPLLGGSTGTRSTPPSLGRIGRAFKPAITYTEAGRRRAAERIFTTWRSEQFRCYLCGEEVQPDELVVVDRAHHAHCRGAA